MTKETFNGKATATGDAVQKTAASVEDFALSLSKIVKNRTPSLDEMALNVEHLIMGPKIDAALVPDIKKTAAWQMLVSAAAAEGATVEIGSISDLLPSFICINTKEKPVSAASTKPVAKPVQ